MYQIKIELRTAKENQEGELIATITGYYFDINFMENKGVFKFDIFDSYNQEIYELYEALFVDDVYLEDLVVLE